MNNLEVFNDEMDRDDYIITLSDPFTGLHYVLLYGQHMTLQESYVWAGRFRARLGKLPVVVFVSKIDKEAVELIFNGNRMMFMSAYYVELAPVILEFIEHAKKANLERNQRNSGSTWFQRRQSLRD